MLLPRATWLVCAGDSIVAQIVATWVGNESRIEAHLQKRAGPCPDHLKELETFATKSCGVRSLDQPKSAIVRRRWSAPNGITPVQALRFDRSHEPLRVGVGIGRSIRRLDDVDPGLGQLRAHSRAPFRVAITNHHVTVADHTVARRRERTRDRAERT